MMKNDVFGFGEIPSRRGVMVDDVSYFLPTLSAPLNAPMPPYPPKMNGQESPSAAAPAG